MDPKPLILMIEDHPDIIEIAEYNLTRAGFQLAKAVDGDEGLKKAVSIRPALVLLDLMLPRMSGLEVCREIRKNSETRNLPIIMLTAKGEESDIVHGLELGADDYMPKPFSPKELIARIRSVLRRSSQRAEVTSVVRSGDLTIDSDRHEVRLGKETLTLTVAEFRILKAIASHPGRVFTRDQLINKMANGDAVIVDRNIDVHVSALRKKLLHYGDRILTVRGVGYKFAE